MQKTGDTIDNGGLTAASTARTGQRTKIIQWAYPSSPNACRFGYGKHGCFVVEIIHYTPEQQPPVALKGFILPADAQEYAARLPEPWDRLAGRAS